MMSISVQTVAGRRTQRAAEDLTAAVNATRPDRLDWKPLDRGRTVLDQLAECAMANLKWANILQARAYVRLRPEVLAGFSELTTRELAIAKLHETTAALVTAILALPDDQIETEIETPWGPYSLADGCLHAYCHP
jgi:hypothetical protein